MRVYFTNNKILLIVLLFSFFACKPSLRENEESYSADFTEEKLNCSNQDYAVFSNDTIRGMGEHTHIREEMAKRYAESIARNNIVHFYDTQFLQSHDGSQNINSDSLPMKSTEISLQLRNLRTVCMETKENGDGSFRVKVILEVSTHDIVLLP